MEGKVTYLISKLQCSYNTLSCRPLYTNKALEFMKY